MGLVERTLDELTEEVERALRLTRDLRSAERLGVQLAWMTERNFYVLGRSRPSREQLYELADELAEIWLAAAGYRS